MTAGWKCTENQLILVSMEDAADTPSPDWLIASLERSEAQIAAGQTVPLEPVLDRLRASIARMQPPAEHEPPLRRKA